MSEFYLSGNPWQRKAYAALSEYLEKKEEINILLWYY